MLKLIRLQSDHCWRWNTFGNILSLFCCASTPTISNSICCCKITSKLRRLTMTTDHYILTIFDKQLGLWCNLRLKLKILKRKKMIGLLITTLQVWFSLFFKCSTTCQNIGNSSNSFWTADDTMFRYWFYIVTIPLLISSHLFFDLLSIFKFFRITCIPLLGSIIAVIACSVVNHICANHIRFGLIIHYTLNAVFIF